MTVDSGTAVSKEPVSLYSAGKRGIAGSVVVVWLKALIGAGAALLAGSVIDRAVSGDDITGPLIWLGILLALRAALSATSPMLAHTTSSRVETDLRTRLIDAMLRAGPWSGKRTGDTVAKATEGVEAVGGLAGTFLPNFIAGMSTPILLAIVVAFVDWPTAVVLLGVLPLIPLLLRMLEKRFRSVSARYRETEDQLAARFLDGIQGLRTLKTLDRAGAYGDDLAEDAERLRVETMGLLRVNQLALLAVDSLLTIGTVVAASVMAAVRLSNDAITVGGAVAIVLLGVMLIEPLNQIGRFFYVGAIGRAAAKQIKEFLSSTSSTPVAEQPPAGAGEGSVVFDNVSFAYPDGTTAVRDLSFSVRPGEKVALVGPSGAGKTTIAHLILGLLQPRTGQFAVGGRATLVPQRPYVFHGTVATNLRLARADATNDELWSVVEAAQLANLIADRQEGLNTPVGERGLDLSGGEAQRLAVARALLVDAPVVVLDEPTSNVDLESEARMRQAIDALTVDRTVIMIAHRRSTISGVDRVLVIDDGRLDRTVDGSDISHVFPKVPAS